jgi:tetratricopeptide (TPR) repeat protein
MNLLRLVAMVSAMALAIAAWTMPATAAAVAEPVKTAPAKTDAPKAAPSPEEQAWAEAGNRLRDAAQKNDLAGAEKACEDAVKAAEAFGPKDERLLSALITLIRVRVMENKFAEAVDPAKRIVDFREKTVGADSLQTAGALNDLAGLLKDQKQLAEAEPVYKRALAIADKAGAQAVPLAIILEMNLAELYRDQGKLAEAEQAAKRAVELREKGAMVLGPQIVPSLQMLGDIYVAEGKFAEAVATQKRAVDIIRQAMSFNRPVMMDSINHLADAYKAAGKFAEAETSYKESIKIAEDGMPPNEITAVTLDKYADLLRKMKRDKDADLAETQAKDIRSKLASEKPAATPTAPAPTASTATAPTATAPAPTAPAPTASSPK